MFSNALVKSNLCNMLFILRPIFNALFGKQYILQKPKELSK